MLGLLNPHRLVIDQHLEGLSPKALIHMHAKVVETNLAVLTYLACELAEPEDAPQAVHLDHSSRGMTKHDLWRHIVPPSLVILTYVRPMPPEPVIVHELGMLPRHRFPISTADHIGI